ncbi:hypothetical protein D0B54_16500 [Solimonas sp. K1W22B-7]|uniref:EthD domain-containing protein n=1 Tax=Solimonas sp. K1W22B-7 TaxID=2303331 RepID=UPI000E331125|nr:EthD domain-containing protein [Solimonas sp. K1W22B-7]AXQ30175.1 hypothetical protein D0B54_16500 [Solimonas sp. K1W22B-7]
MEKVIYTLWKRPEQTTAEFADSLRTQLAAQLLQAGVRGLQLNIDDAEVAPAAGIRQIAGAPLPDALLQLWLDSAIGLRRAPVDALVAATVARHDAYLVTESEPLRNERYPAAPGQRSYGFAQIALLKKPERLGYPEWLAHWHDGHTPVAIETQSTFEYRQNVVVRALTPGARPYDAIVEECFPPAAMSDPQAFFDAVGDPEKFQRNLDRMMASVGRFLDLGTIDVLATSQYRLA